MLRASLILRFGTPHNSDFVAKFEAKTATPRHCPDKSLRQRNPIKNKKARLKPGFLILCVETAQTGWGFNPPPASVSGD